MAAVGTVTISPETYSSPKKITFSWTSSDDTGAVSGTTTAEAHDGQILTCVTVPGSGDEEPTVNYDVTLLDEAGCDVLAGQGANRSNVTTEYITASMGCVANDKLELRVANAGNSKTGTVVVFLR